MRADATSFYLQTPDGQSPGPFQPGQYLSVAVDFADEDLRQLRQYSLSDSPGKPWWRITVKREAGQADTPAGRVSNWLHANLRQGGSLLAGAAYGDFTPALDGSHPLVLLSAGVGITPMVSILNTLCERGATRPVHFAHAARDGLRHALRADLAAARASYPALREQVFYQTPREADRVGFDYHHAGRMQLDLVLDRVTDDAEFLLCGPASFMRQQWQALLERGVSPARIQREVFGPELLDHLL